MIHRFLYWLTTFLPCRLIDINGNVSCSVGYLYPICEGIDGGFVLDVRCEE